MEYKKNLVKRAIDIKEKINRSDVEDVISELIEAYNDMYGEVKHLEKSLNDAIDIYEKYDRCNCARITVKRDLKRLQSRYSELQQKYDEIENQLKKYQEHVILKI